MFIIMNVTQFFYFFFPSELGVYDIWILIIFYKWLWCLNMWKPGMELSNLSFRQWLYNHCHAFFFFIQGPTNCMFNPISGCSTSPTTPNLTAASILPSLQFILQQNSTQRVCVNLYFLPYTVEILCLKIFLAFFLYKKYWQEELMKLIKYVEQTSGMALIWIIHFFAA